MEMTADALTGKLLDAFGVSIYIQYKFAREAISRNLVPRCRIRKILNMVILSAIFFWAEVIH